VHSAYAEIKDSSFALGRELLNLGPALGAAHPVRINGSTVYAGGHHVKLGLVEVLDQVEKDCEEHGLTLQDDIDKLPARYKKRIPEDVRTSKKVALVREQRDHEGAIACLAVPPDTRGLRKLAARFEAFMTSGDLSEVGKLRYVFARSDTQIGGTNVVSVWSDGPLNLWQMVEPQGDAPGSDLTDFPRPPHSVRVLSAALEGTSYGVRSYLTNDSPDKLLSYYDGQLKTEGWKPALPNNQLPADARDGRAFFKNGAAVIFSVSRDGDQTRFDLTQIASHGEVTVTATEPSAVSSLLPW
jgi:hypothetical protein